MIESIQAALSRGDSAAAIAAAQSYLNEHPDDARALHLLGVAQRIAGDLAGAAESLDRAVALTPDDPNIQFARAMLALSRGEPEAAAAALTAVTAQDPNALAAYVLSGHAALARGDASEAAAQLRLAQRIAPEHPHVLAMEGNIAMARGQAKDAIGPLTRALKAVPEDGFVLSCLGLAFLAADNPAFAEQTLRRALQQQPESRRLRLALIEALRRQDQAEEALAEVATLRAARPADTAVLALAADIEISRGNLDGALEAYRALLAASPRPGDALRPVLQVLVGTGAVDAALALRNEWLEARPDDESIWLAGALPERLHPRTLHGYAQRWVARLPDSAAALTARAGAAEALGDLGSAEADADLALGLDPTATEAHWTKLRAELRRDPDAALARAERLLAAARNLPARRESLIWHGLALDALDRCEEAARSWAEARALPLPARPLALADPPALDTQAHDDGVPPRLLVGLPGSVVVRVVRLLQGVPELRLLDDRFGRNPRPDGLGPVRPDGAMATQTAWRALLERGGIDPARALDWLLHFDTRHANLLPDARLLAVLGDPRDLLLDWLAMGSPQEYVFPGIDQAGIWLGRAYQPLLRRLAEGREQDLFLRREAMESDPAEACRRIAAFCALDETPDVAALQRASLGLGELPTNLPAGRWRLYAEPLAAGFAPLHEVATQLGYPAA